MKYRYYVSFDIEVVDNTNYGENVSKTIVPIFNKYIKENNLPFKFTDYVECEYDDELKLTLLTDDGKVHPVYVCCQSEVFISFEEECMLSEASKNKLKKCFKKVSIDMKNDFDRWSDNEEIIQKELFDSIQKLFKDNKNIKLEDICMDN